MNYGLEFMLAFIDDAEKLSADCERITRSYNAKRDAVRKSARDEISQFQSGMAGDINSLYSNRKKVAANLDHLLTTPAYTDDQVTRLSQAYIDTIEQSGNTIAEKLNRYYKDEVELRKRTLFESDDQIINLESRLKQELEEKVNKFLEIYPPDEYVEKIRLIYDLEPDPENYQCVQTLPEDVRIGDFGLNRSDIRINEYVSGVLHRYYPYLFKNTQSTNNISKEIFSVPDSVSFEKDLNYLFTYKGKAAGDILIKQLDSIGMRLFMMLPPNRINFIFIDPINVGDSFAMFTRLVEADDKTSKVINGQIWTKSEQIGDILRVTADHIANVTQRCLQGMYKNIQEYNKAAGQNAEAYQVIMAMDFPAGFDEDSLKQLEQIIGTGPRCGVFTLLGQNEEQLAKIDDKKLKPLLTNIQSGLARFVLNEFNELAVDASENKTGRKILLNIPPVLNLDELSKVVPKLKEGIKTAEKIEIPFDSIVPPKSEWFKGDSTENLSIPFGIHGANSIQHLTFGVGEYHHALIGGMSGSGKSSTLHAIIMSALIKYPADQLQIYLVDFKRGVEFKIYANYNLGSFRVIAVESEREFGESVLSYLDDEAQNRASLFKSYNVDDIEGYRKKTHETLPRILLIIDEFQVLFGRHDTSESNKKACTYMENIIRQGRGFGIHAILASQTMAETGGISAGIWGQVGVRIALKCAREDASFLLGAGESSINLLSDDNPGQAIYHLTANTKLSSTEGRVFSNTVFRVAYLDRDTQEGYLEYIEKHAPKIETCETRVMLSNVEDYTFHPFKQFVRGERPDFTRNRMLLGESLAVTDNMRIVFKKESGSNLLVLGNGELKARTLFTFAVISAVLHGLSVNDYILKRKKNIYVLDYAPFEESSKDTLKKVCDMLPDCIKYTTAKTAKESLTVLYEEMIKREKGQAAVEDTYLLIFGLQRARELRSNNIYQTRTEIDDFDEFGSAPNQALNVKPYEMFFNLIQRGPEVGINLMVWEDSYKVFTAHYQNMLQSFDLRIAFTMPKDDAINFIEDPDGDKIPSYGAEYNHDGNYKFRPYHAPDMKWVEEICCKIKEY